MKFIDILYAGIIVGFFASSTIISRNSAISFYVSNSIVIRLIGLAFFMAFQSLRYQINGLIGKNGLIPLMKTTKLINKWLTTDSVPKTRIVVLINEAVLVILNYINASDPTAAQLLFTCQFASLLAVIYPHPIIYIYLYWVYYSIQRAAGPFMHFQWDSLLLESAVLSVLASLASSHLSAFICNLLFRLLLFRLMFGSGVVKVACGDKTWRDLTAMSYHCWTQPLPRRMARFAYSMPSYLLHFLTIGNHVVELAVPLLSLTSPWSAGVVVPLMAYLSLQIGISALGYYGFFNFLSAALAVSLVDDRYVGEACRLTTCYSSNAMCQACQQMMSPSTVSTTFTSSLSDLIICLCGVAITMSSAFALWKLFDRYDLITIKPPEFIEWTHTFLSPFFLGSHYGLFANMTTTRPEVIIEVLRAPAEAPEPQAGEQMAVSPPSDSGAWEEVNFLYKPGDVDVGPTAVWPPTHMPRLDWRLWFVALAARSSALPSWMYLLLIGIMENNPDIMSLLPPSEGEKVQASQIRVRLFYYKFSEGDSAIATTASLPSVEQHRGKFWTRTFARSLVPAASLQELYLLYDAQEVAAGRAGPRPVPTAESAADIIKRTIFKGLKTKR